MKKGIFFLAATAICTVFCATGVYAEALSNQELSERVAQLEKKLGAEDGILPDAWSDRIALSGTIEVEAGHVGFDPDQGDSSDESDISVATVELGVEARIVKHVSGNILFLYEDGEDIVVDEAVITLSGEDVIPAYLSAGEMYVPFGNFESHMISDPLTLEIAETREAALQVGVEAAGFYGSAFVFNGDVEEADDDDNHIDNFGANAGYALESGTFSLDAGVSYINNLLDADGWEDPLATDEDENGAPDFRLKEYVGGMGAYAVVGFGPFSLIGEYVAALDEIEGLDEADAPVTLDEISAWNLEAGYTFAVADREAVVAAAYQGSNDAGGVIPETKYLGTFGIGIFESTNLAFEYAQSQFENDDEERAVTVQLAVEF
jgi:hypothetical protein